MSLNEDALYRLLEHPNGPVQQFVELKAEELVVRARERVGDIMHRYANKDEIANQVEWQRESGGHIRGGWVTVGIRSPKGSFREGTKQETISQWLARKEEREGVWLRAAAREIFRD
jgi:hypothetical protein